MPVMRVAGLGVAVALVAVGGLVGVARADFGVGPADVCLLRGDVAIEVEAVPLEGAGATGTAEKSKLLVYRDGRFCAQRGTQADLGRMSREQTRALVAAVRKLPRPPGGQEGCDAVPSEKITLRGGGREIAFSQPCGERVSPETHALLTRLHTATQLGCLEKPGAELLRWETTDNDTLTPPSPRVEVTVLFENGQWTDAIAGATTRRGCLTEAERKKIGAQLARLEVATRQEKGTTCQAVPTREVTVTAGKKTATWSSPCSLTVPTPALDKFLAALSDAFYP